MKAQTKIIISGRIDKDTKDWIEKHPLSQSQLINYGLCLIRIMECNLKESKVFITAITLKSGEKEQLPF